MNYVQRDILNYFTIVYDEILIFSKSPQDHVIYVGACQIIRESAGCVKCAIHVSTPSFLIFTVSDGFCHSQSSLRKLLQQLLGFANF